jgi:hypothetical protein
MAAQGEEEVHGMPVWMRKSISQQQWKGIRVLLPYNRPAAWRDATGRSHVLCKAEQQQQFLWKLKGCQDGLQHFKLCTPAALQDPSQLDCCFCGSWTGSWVLLAGLP